MKVLNLRCANGHGFEGWFGSDDEFMAQNGNGQIECPMCTDHVISRMPSAPRLNLATARGDVALATEAQPAAAVEAGEPAAAMQALWLKAARHVVENTVDVGDRFAEEARRMHYGEAEARGIRGQATAQERAALRDEGIETLSMPLPAAVKGPLQ